MDVLVVLVYLHDRATHARHLPPAWIQSLVLCKQLTLYLLTTDLLSAFQARTREKGAASMDPMTGACLADLNGIQQGLGCWSCMVPQQTMWLRNLVIIKGI